MPRGRPRKIALAVPMIQDSASKVSDGHIDVVIFIDNKPIAFSFEASGLRGSIQGTRLNARDLREILLPAISKVFGRVT